MAKIVISALGPSISEQCAKQNLKPTGIPIGLLDELSEDLTRAHLWGLLSDTEITKARKRLVYKAKFVQIDDENQIKPCKPASIP